MQNFPKQYLSHLESKLDVPYVHFDRLDKIYAMVKSILHFGEVDQTGLTSLDKRPDRFPDQLPDRIKLKIRKTESGILQNLLQKP